jgi:hypothetical protein
MKPQKFKRGDVVHIAKNLGSMMNHFPNDQDAIIMGSYRDQYGGDDVDSWTVMFCDSGGESSWYETWQLTFLRHGGEVEIEKVKMLRARREASQRDVNWIVSNWLNIRENPPGATMAELMKLVGITNPWGKHGEGITYYANMMRTRQLLDPVLSIGDLSKLNEFLEKMGRPPVKESE